MTSKLLNRGFLSLIMTQFFGAANDNILKGVLIYMVIDGAWAGQLGSGGQGIVSVCFTLPFISLSGYAGQFADRNSKRYVSVLVKVIEIPIAHGRADRILDRQPVDHAAGPGRFDVPERVLWTGQVRHDSGTGRHRAT